MRENRSEKSMFITFLILTTNRENLIIEADGNELGKVLTFL